ncbi:MFS allantoate transporter [Mollisia scopiformis]|uniref:MFS allantoate transporter n=1 Tax=Mollisia scopiformis TaxID=149040 RepID=A0A194XGS4_MOLSC|nr:MFS allantoate transporter [Mollisia scopiformis]KUJ19341.1 MFS allantoate transporter [Mollisia scopiformis]
MADEEKKAVPGADNISPIERGEANDFRDAEKIGDIGFDLFQQSHQYDPAQLERDAIKVRRKLDFIVLPMMMMTYMLSFLDKQTLNYSNAYGLQADTHMKGIDYSWVSSALYFGWLVGAYPWNLALQRFPIGRLMGCMLFVWGAVCMLQAAVFNFSGFFAVRFFLGMLEACISPAWVLLTSMLWTREEQPLRTSFWLSVNGVSSIIGALLSFGLGHVDNLAVPNWKLIYLVVGAITFAWGFVILLYLPDGPHNAKMLTEYERVVAVWRVSKNRTGVKDPKILRYQIKEALFDVKTWLLLIGAACVGILNGGVTNFASSLIKGFGFNPLKTSLLQTPGGAFELVFVILLGYLATVKNMLGATIIIACIPGIAGLVGIMKISLAHRYALVACTWLQGILGSPIVLMWTLPALNCAGHSKRATQLGLFFVIYCAGNIAGPHLFFADEAPRYLSAIKGLLIAYCIAAFVQILYTTLCWMENKKRDRRGLHADEEAEALEGFGDLTDKENLHFRYSI